jgi:hypothetical protein
MLERNSNVLHIETGKQVNHGKVTEFKTSRRSYKNVREIEID